MIDEEEHPWGIHIDAMLDVEIQGGKLIKTGGLHMKVNVVCVQMEPILRNVQGNLSKMVAFIVQIMSERPETQLIVFPELITSGYECGKDFYDLAETVADGRCFQEISEYAKRYHVHVIYGFPERDSKKKDILYNSAVLISDEGNVIGVYRKVHPFAGEKQYFRPGDEYPLFETNIGRIGIMICWDTAFPEVARTYALKGADLIAISTNWEKPYLSDVITDNQSDWDLVTRARAFDNCIYVVAANRIGFDETLGFFGRSKIIGPTGNPLEELNEEIEGVISAELDYDLPVLLKKKYYTLLEDRRPETYSELVKHH
jgi:predicted amidohydrolase